MNNKLLFITFVFCITNKMLCISQVTVTEVKKIEIDFYPKPKPYDSLQSWKTQQNMGDYKKYIGLKLYLPPFENQKLGEFSENEGFIFSKHATFIDIDKKASLPNSNNPYNQIMTFVYHPYNYYSGNLNRYTYVNLVSNNNDVGDTYYTLVDMIYGQRFEKFQSDRRNELRENSEYKDLYRSQNLTNNLKIDYNPVLVLKNEKNNDTVYTTEATRFIIVPHFTAMQNKYKGKKLIWEGSYTRQEIDYNYKINYEDDNGNVQTKGKVVTAKPNSKWFCKDVTVMKPSNQLTFILSNENEEIMYLQDLDKFITAEDFEKRERIKKLNQKDIALKNKIDSQKQKNAERKLLEAKISKYSKLYGDKFGNFVAHENVCVGMSKDMCYEAWGYPFSKNKTTTKDGIYEIWYFSYGYSLFFKNDLLAIINE